MIQQRDLQLAGLFDAPQTHTRELHKQAALEGEFSALKWLHGICPQACVVEGPRLMFPAAASGCMAINSQDRTPRNRLQGLQPLPCIIWTPSKGCFWQTCLKGPAPAMAPFSLLLESIMVLLPFNGLALIASFGQTARIASSWSLLPETGTRPCMYGWEPVHNPWSVLVCEEAANLRDTIMLSEDQYLPAPWGMEVNAAAAAQPDTSTLQWLGPSRAQDPTLSARFAVSRCCRLIA